jgi:signal transduction histidine kinase
MSKSTPTSIIKLQELWAFATTRFAPVLVVAYQILALVALVTVAINATKFFRIPFIGSFIEHTMVFNNAESVNPNRWGAQSDWLKFGMQLQTIDDVEIRSVQHFYDVLRDLKVGELIGISVLDLLDDNPQEVTLSIELQYFPLSDQIAWMVIPFLVSLIYFGCGLWVFGLRRFDTKGQVYSTFTASAAIVIGGIFEIFTTTQLTGLWTFSLGMTAGTLIHFALVFPEKIRLVRKYPFLGWLSYIPTVILVIWAFPALYDFNNPLSYVLPWRFGFIFIGAAVFFFVGMTIYRRFNSLSPVVRHQSQILLFSAIISVFSFVIWSVFQIASLKIPFTPYLLSPLAIFPLAFTYTILKYRILKTDYIFSRVVLYSFLTILAVIGYALLVSGLSLVMGAFISPNQPLIIGLMVFLMALLLIPLRTQLQKLIDRVFFKGQQVYRERVEAFSGDLSKAMNLASIMALLRTNIDEMLLPEQQHIFVLDSMRDAYLSVPDGSGQPTTDINFVAKSALVQVLMLEKAYIFIRVEDDLPNALESDRSRLSLLGAQLFVPFPGRDQSLLGFIALTPRKSGEPYTTNDLKLLEALCDQTALAVERAQVIDDLERRVNEMNILIRVAQGVNITVRFDDILELIYTQTSRLVPTKDFWVMLYDSENDLYQYAFYLEDDRRMLEIENNHIFTIQDIAQEVILSGRPIVVNDYSHECSLRGLRKMVDGLYAWVGVPLNAGAVTIGAMSLASRDPTVVYNDHQVSLLQAVADQATGAIVKSRLLENTERNARQLSLLNEVGKNLTSMLDLPSLLNQILESAIEILNCEAGTLFVVDEETGELVFEVVAGPVADQLTGRRLPPGTGHAGRAAQSRKPVIVNEVRTTEEWNRDSDQETGFHTQDLLIVPIIISDRVVGVVEVINRKDKISFKKDDLELLSAFTSQAAVALENARLYTLTDQQLAARVDELSVMQRIDRELNDSLDITRSMEITLDWAVRQSGAEAGLVGIVENEGVRIMADRGYHEELIPYRDTWLPLDLPGLRDAVEKERTQRLYKEDPDINQNSIGLLTDTKSQVVIPIRREEDVIGLLLLETLQDNTWSDDTHAFLSRLTDHAAIAIANAQLFSQVQSADLAKTEFVSQVSHELKNPMTSVRGYTDLLISGAVGEVSEAQQNFLSTVRANILRMTTIVEDLADITRIESGNLRLEFNSVDIGNVVSEVDRAQRRDIEEKGQSLRIDIPKDLPAVWGDRTRLLQILINLVSNASKYTPEGGGINIQAEQTPNHWDPDGTSDVVLITVQDEGIGITEQDQVKVFSKFFRSDDPKAREAPGTGLGLNITRNLVELQGGKIWFDSEYGKGTTFYFTIPITEM